MNKKFLFYALFFIALIIAFLAFLGLSSDALEKRSKTIATVQPFRFVNQNGQAVTEKDLEGKVVLVNFFFTKCRTICPQMNNTLKSIYEQFRNEPRFIVLSHTSDPENDSVPKLKRYADSAGAGPNWWFVTGNKDSLYLAARYSYAVDDQKMPVSRPEDDFIHTQLFALVNKNGEVKKKIYDSFKADEMKELIEDIRQRLDE
jgi:protein SCO1